MAPLPPLNALRAFEVAARRGGFAAAADELNVTPAAIGQQVRQLEALVGGPLFHRDGRRLRLTERGAAGLDRLSRGFDLLGEASAALRGVPESEAVTLALPADFAQAWLAPRLAGWMDDQTVLTLATYEAQAPSFAAADLTITFGLEPPPGAQSERLMGEVATPAARADIAASIQTVNDLFEHRLIYHGGEPEGGWRAWFARQGALVPQARAGIYVGDNLSALALAEAGAGLVLAPRSLAGPAFAHARLAAVFPDGDMALAQSYFLSRPKGRRVSAAARSLGAWIRAQAVASVDLADEL